MTKRYAMVAVLVLSTAFLVSGCRAFSSTYGSADADLAAKPLAEGPAAAASSAGTSADSSSNAPAPVDYTTDDTECKTPNGVTVVKNPAKIMGNSGWVLPIDGEQVAVSAVKKGDYSAAITIQKSAADKSVSTLSFTVKQTAADKFSACDFNYSEGNDRIYSTVTGALSVDQINTVDATLNKVSNSGSFALVFSRTDATKVQSVYLGASSPADLGGMDLSGSYFLSSITESAAQ